MTNRKKILEYIVDETLIKVGSGYIRLWVSIEPKTKQILALSYLKREICLLQRFISGLVQIHGKHPVSTDGGTWYPMACWFLKLIHHIHSYYEKSTIE